MTILRRQTVLLVAMLVCCMAADAAQKKLHGTIVSINSDKLVLRDGTDKSVSLADGTQYCVADYTSAEFQKAQLADLKAGEYVAVSLSDSGSKADTIFAASDENHLSAAWSQQAANARADQARATTQTAPGAPRSPLIPAVKVMNTHRFFQLHDQYVKRAREGNINVLFLGDSITEGWHKAQPIWDARYGPLKSANFGVSGDRIEHVLWRIENGELDVIQPKVIVLLIGTNNANVDDGKLIAKGVKNLVEKIHEKTPSSKILLLSIFPRDKTTDKLQMPRINMANPLIAKLDNGSTVRVLDLGPKFLGPDGRLNESLFSDHLHPNSAGYTVWADAMQPLLDEMLKDESAKDTE